MTLRLTEDEYAAILSRGKRVKAPVVVVSVTPTDGAKRLLQVLLDAGIPGPWYREFTFHQERDWRVDVAAPQQKIGIEVDGMVHRIKKRFLSDIAKHNALIISGWRYLRVTPRQVDNGEALILVQALTREIHTR